MFEFLRVVFIVGAGLVSALVLRAGARGLILKFASRDEAQLFRDLLAKSRRMRYLLRAARTAPRSGPDGIPPQPGPVREYFLHEAKEAHHLRKQIVEELIRRRVPAWRRWLFA